VDNSGKNKSSWLHIIKKFVPDGGQPPAKSSVVWRTPC